MNLKLPLEQQELQRIARTFAYQRIQRRAREFDRVADPAAAYPEDLVRRANALGLRLLRVPRAFGGREVDALTEAVVLEELCVGDVGFGTLLAHTLANMVGQIGLCRTLLWRAAWSIDRDRGAAPKLEGMAKVAATRMAADVAVRAHEVFGGWGILRGKPIEKLVRNATAVLRAFVGDSALQENIAALHSAEADARLALARTAS